MKTLLLHSFGLIFVASLFLTACQSSTVNQSTTDILDENVRHYFFMEDSVQLEVKVLDTLFFTEWQQLTDESEANLIQSQEKMNELKELSAQWEQKMYDLQDAQAELSEINQAKVMHLSYELNMADLTAAQMTLSNNQRIYKNLYRESIDSIYGYETQVSYQIEGESNTFSVLMNAHYQIIN